MRHRSDQILLGARRCLLSLVLSWSVISRPFFGLLSLVLDSDIFIPYYNYTDRRSIKYFNIPRADQGDQIEGQRSVVCENSDAAVLQLQHLYRHYQVYTATRISQSPSSGSTKRTLKIPIILDLSGPSNANQGPTRTVYLAGPHAHTSLKVAHNYRPLALQVGDLSSQRPTISTTPAPLQWTCARCDASSPGLAFRPLSGAKGWNHLSVNMVIGTR